MVADRAGGRFGRRRDADDRGARRQSLGAQRRENLHHQRPLRRLLRGHGGHGQIERLTRNQRLRTGKRNEGVSSGEKRKQTWNARERYLRSDFQRLSCAARESAGGGRRRIHRQPENFGWRTYFDCGTGVGHGPRRARSGHKICEAAKAVWPADQRVSIGTIQTGGYGHTGGSSAAACLSSGVAGGQKRRALHAAIENHQPEAEALLRLLFPHTGKAYLTGVTGAPGTGKSTLVDRLAAYHRKRKEEVGVIAVDPTSPYSGGAILGDRIRMQGHAGDAGTFIRSMATRGFLGGLARATAEVALLLDAAGKKHVLIETVGVGQDEIDVVRLADCVLVALVPGLGDDIQNMKAGLMEIGDIFVLNKADREGADRLEQQLLAMLSLVMPRDGWHPPVVRTVATENKGVQGLAETVAKFRMHFEASGERQRKQVEHWKNRLLELLRSRLLERALGGAGGEATLAALAGEVADRKKDPFTAVNEILRRSGLSS